MSEASMDPTPPQSKADLTQRMRAGSEALEAVIAGASQAALVAPGPEGWSVKDHVAHLAAWRRKTLAALAGRPEHEALGVDQALYESGDEEGINAALQRQAQGISLAEALADYRKVTAELLRFVEDLPEERLLGPYRPKDPQSTLRIIDAIPGNSYEHDLEHRPWIEAVLSAVRG